MMNHNSMNVKINELIYASVPIRSMTLAEEYERTGDLSIPQFARKF